MAAVIRFIAKEVWFVDVDKRNSLKKRDVEFIRNDIVLFKLQ